MALDLSKVKNRLESLKNTNTKAKHMWKPNKGKNVIRIIPYNVQADNPFVELLFHYGINQKTYLSPSTFNRPDPIVELSNKLKKTGDKEEWKEGRKLEPKMRVYVPILVRGAEQEGVKYWGMGKQVYQEILSIIADPDYGDITDVRNGRDLVVEFKPPEETGKTWGETTIRCKPNQSVAFDPSDAVVKEAVKNQTDILTFWPELSYDELTKVMDEWLNAPTEGSTDGAAGSVPSDDEDEQPTKSPIAAAKAAAAAAKVVTPAAAPASATIEASAAPAPKPNAQAVADEFDELFSSKS